MDLLTRDWALLFILLPAHCDCLLAYLRDQAHGRKLFRFHPDLEENMRVS